MSADERVGSSTRLQLATELAVRGGRMLLEPFHRAQASAGAPAVVPAADEAIGDRLAADVATAFPEDAVVGGETGSGVREPRCLYSWVVGSIDGGSDFGRGLPGFAVTVGVLRNGMPFVGAVYDPVARWLFSACAGRGAWLNDRPLRARPASLSRSSLVAVGSPREAGAPPFTEEWLRRYRVRRIGSTALQLCYVAMGALDLVHDHRATLREVVGAATIVLEAGGVVTRDDGSPLFPAPAARLTGGPIAMLAGNQVSHAEALAEVALVAQAQSSVGGVAVGQDRARRVCL